MHPLQISPYMPQLGRDLLDRSHALFTIVESLRYLGLSEWTTTLLGWLGRFDGLEVHIQEESDPVLCVRQVLMGFVAVVRKGLVWKGQQWIQDLKQQIVDRLVALDFVHHRTYWSDRPPQMRLEWHPLKQSWLEFIELGQQQEQLCTWRPRRGNPMLSGLCKQWLLQPQAIRE